MTIRLHLLLLVSLLAHASDPVFDQYQLKAAFLYNFAHFVEWPAGTFANPTEPITICIVGRNPFGSTLEDMVRGKKIGDRTFGVRRISDPQHASQCQIVFIGAEESKRIPGILQALQGASVLTVGETADFMAAGGMIAFKIEDTRLRIQVAPGVAEHAHLRISSKLLGLAEIVKPQP